MPLLKNQSIFVKQNYWLKLFILLLGSVMCVAAPVKALVLMTGLNLLYLIVSPSIFISIWIGIKKFIPFFAGYSLFAMLMGMEYIGILYFQLRILNLILLMVYFAAGLNLKRLMEDMQHLKSSGWFSTALFFILAISVFIKEFRAYYLKHKTKPDNMLSDNRVAPPAKGVAGLLPGFVDAIAANWQNRDKVEAATRILFERQYAPPVFLTLENMLGMIYITALVVVVAL